MSTVRKLRVADEQIELLRDLLAVNREALAELRGLRADLRRRDESAAAAPLLIAALEERYGPSSFMVRMVLEDVDEDPHGPLAEAVAANVDMNLSPRSRATALGALFSRLRGVEVVAEQRPRIYRLNL